ncbi:MAG: HDOD domain-containing protein [bacterium]
MKKRILFVDDEPHVLKGLQGLLHRQRQCWDLVFAEGGEAGLAAMAAEPCDVIVTDMRMPGLDGNSLLQLVKDHYPRTVRIALSGFTEIKSLMNSVTVAHQYLAKPCEPDTLIGVIERACGLLDIFTSSEFLEIVSTMDKLPASPRLYNELTRALNNPEVTIRDLANIVAKDAAVTAKILQIVNSSFFGPARRLVDIQDATTYIGANLLRNLVLSIEIAQSFSPAEWPDGFSIDALQNHTVLTASITERIAPDGIDPREAYTTALLHDVGKLVLASEFPKVYTRMLAESRRQNIAVHEFEYSANAQSHAEIGAYLLGLWGLPLPVIVAVANHHRPWRLVDEGFNLTTAVYISDHLAQQMLVDSPDAANHATELEEEYLDAIGVLGNLPGWQQIAEGLREPEPVS